MNEPFAFRTHEKMREVLLDQNALGPSIHYYMIRGGTDKGNITIWESGLVGREYIKTYGHYHADEFPETYWVLSGEGIAILQKRTGEESGVIQDLKVVRLHAGDRLDIPAGYGHMVANVGTDFLVTKDNSPVYTGRDSADMPLHADYEPIKKMKGFAYFVVEHDGKPALTRNHHYKEVVKEDVGGFEVVR